MNTVQTDRYTDILQDEAHVWLIEPESIRDPSVLKYIRSILDSNERKRLDRFHFPDDGHSYLVSHALLRSVLSQYANVSPSDWRFGQGQHGRPEIIPDNLTRLRFNLTHTAGLAACIVTFDDDCGIDAEKIRNRRDPLGIAKRMFSAPELDQLIQCDGQAFLEYFYEHWTLREAYVKARGIGISFPTRELRFRVEDQGTRINLDNMIEERESNWNFKLMRPHPAHIVAVALRNTTGADKRIRIHNFDFNS